MAPLSPHRPAAGSGKAAAVFLPKAEAPWLRFFHDLAAGGQCQSGTKTPDESKAMSDSAEALARCAKLAVQLEQIAREIAAQSRLAGLDFELVFEQVLKFIVSAINEHADSRPEGGQEQQHTEKEGEKTTTTSEYVMAFKDDAETTEETRAEACVCEPTEDKVELPPVMVSMISGETMALPDVEPGTSVRQVLRHLQGLRPLNRNNTYSLLDGPRILTAEELVVAGQHYTAVVRQDRRLLQHPYQVGDLEVGDIIRTRWKQNSCKAFHARILSFTEEQPPRICVQWQYTSGHDWDWQTAPIHFDWVLDIKRFAPQ